MPTTINFKDIIDKNDWRPCASSVTAVTSISSNTNATLISSTPPISDYRGNNYSNNQIYWIPSTFRGVVAYNTVLDSYMHLQHGNMTQLGGSSTAGASGCFVSTLSPKGKVISASSSTNITLDSTMIGGNSTTLTWDRNINTVTISMPRGADTFTASQSGNILTVTAGPSTGAIQVGMAITTGSWASTNTNITGFLTGRGGTGTYYVSTSQTIASESASASNQHYLSTGQWVYVTASTNHAAIAVNTLYSVTYVNNSRFTIQGVNTGSTSGTVTIGCPIRTNQWADRGDGHGYMIRIIGNSSGGSGKTEERRIIANSGGIDSVSIFNGTISTTTLTVTNVQQGTIVPGMMISGTGITAGTTISQQLTGTTGGAGTYTVSVSQTVSSAVQIMGVLSVVGTCSPTITLDQPLSFTPQAGDSFELLSGSVFQVGGGSGQTSSVQSFDCSLLNSAFSIRTSQRFHTASATNGGTYLIHPKPLDPLLVPWNKIPGEGYETGASTYDTSALTGTNYKNVKGCLLATATANNTTAATTTGSSISGTILTVGTITAGTIAPGQILVGGTVLPTTIILYNISGGSTNGSTWAVSQSQTVTSSSLNCYEASLTGQASAGDATVLANQYRNYQIRIVEDATTPTSVGQRRRIGFHSAGPSPKYMLTAQWTVTPSATAKYVIENWEDCILLFNTATGVQTYKLTNYSQDSHQLYNTWSSSATFDNTNSGSIGGIQNFAQHFFAYFNSGDTQKTLRPSYILLSVNNGWAYYDISADLKGAYLIGAKTDSILPTNLTLSTTNPSIEYNAHTNNGEEFYLYHDAFYFSGQYGVAIAKVKGASLSVYSLPSIKAPYGNIVSGAYSVTTTNTRTGRLGVGLYVDPSDQTIKIPTLYWVNPVKAISEMYELLLLQ